jgi:hypothetical protein
MRTQQMFHRPTTHAKVDDECGDFPMQLKIAFGGTSKIQP